MSDDKNICPLTFTVGKGSYDQEISNFDYCVKERCPWWIKKIGGHDLKACSIRVLAENVFFIQEFSSRITK